MRQRARHITKADETPEFQRFWEIWQPHMRPTDGRGAARNEFFRHVEERGADPQDIVDGAAWFFRNLKSEDTSFVPMASVWLNRGAYEDFCEKERAFQQRKAEAPQAKVVQFQPGNTAFLREWNKREA
jgi:hypothetical protein